MSGSEPIEEIRAAWSAYRQAPVVLIALEGPELRIAAWSGPAEEVTGTGLRGLGTSLLEPAFIDGTGMQEALLEVYRSGKPFTSSEWRTAIPTPDGGMAEYWWDFTYTPWLWPDGSTRGVLSFAVDVTDSVVRRLRAEDDSDQWRDRFRTSHEALSALQAALLPSAVPVLPTVEVAARYLLADDDTSAGGDWFGAYVVQDRLVLVVGDVVGHGVAASATMGRLRAVLEERLMSGAGVGEALEALDRYAEVVTGGEAATVCALVLDPSTGAVEYCTAGHPPPLVVDGEEWRYLEPTGAGPLRSGRGFRTREDHLDVGSVLVLYSDGLVERPGRTWQQSTVEVGQCVTNAANGRPVLVNTPRHVADRICEVTLEVATRETGYTDDITVLVARRVEAPEPVSWTVAAEAGSVLDIVTGVDKWLERACAGEADRRDVGHAVVELVTNAVEHGSPRGSQDTVEVTARLGTDGRIVVTVGDRGRWEGDAPGAAAPGDVAPDADGIGLAMVRRLTDRLEVATRPDGTTVTVVRALSRPAPVRTVSIGGAATAGDLATLAGTELALYTAPDRPGVLVADGPVLLTTVENLKALLDVESRAGLRDLTVDLSRVDVLASVGVRALQAAMRLCEEHGRALTLVAPPGSVAAHVLAVTATPHVAHRPEPPPD